MLRKLGLILLGAVLTVLLLQTHTPAQTDYNLRSDIFQLRSQVSALQAQVNQLSRQGANPSGRAPATPVPRSVAPTDGQIVDRLATLAIEAKERLNALEARVGRLEQRAR